MNTNLFLAVLEARKSKVELKASHCITTCWKASVEEQQRDS
jgi:hypothetical protein